MIVVSDSADDPDMFCGASWRCDATGSYCEVLTASSRGFILITIWNKQGSGDQVHGSAAKHDQGWTDDKDRALTL